jgi:hypothetical protein
VKRRMGHEDIRTTLNTYGHLFPDREDDLVAALDRRRRRARRADMGRPLRGAVAADPTYVVPSRVTSCPFGAVVTLISRGSVQGEQATSTALHRFRPPRIAEGLCKQG